MFGLFRLPPVVYLVLAPIIAAFAIFMFFDDRAEEAAKAAARTHAAPAAVPLERFDRTRNVGQAGEAVILAQLDVDHLMDLTRTKNGSVQRRWMMGALYATTAPDRTMPAPGVLVQDGALTDDQIRAMIVGNGPFGPIIRIDGKITSASETGVPTSEGIASRVTIAADPLYIDPFESGRDAGLAPDNAGRDGSIGVLVLGLLVAGYGFFRRWRVRSRGY